MTDENVRIVYLGGDPSSGARPGLALPKEVEAMEQALNTHGVNNLPLVHDTQVTVDALFSALKRYPGAQVLHLAGHAHAELGLLIEDEDGKGVCVPGRWLAEALVRHRNIRVVVLSACETIAHAQVLAELVDCVVATSDKIGDKAVVKFAQGFYRELAQGSDIEAAYQSAVTRVGFHYTQGAQSHADRYRLCHRDAIDPRWVQIDPSVPAPPTALERHRRTRERLNARASSSEVVVHANVPEWRSVLPAGNGNVPGELAFDPGAYAANDPWQRRYPIAVDAWDAGLAAVIEVADQVRDEAKGMQAHVVARMPLSLFAVLGCRLELHGRAPIFHAQSHLKGAAENDWQPWGPGMQSVRPPQDQAPVFRGLSLSTTPASDVRHVGVSVSITRPISTADANTALRRAAPSLSARRLHEIAPIAGTSHHAITDRNVDRAADELLQFFESLARPYPELEAVHVFYTGPAALLARALCKSHHGRGRVFMYEYFRGHGYARVVDVGAGKLALEGRVTHAR